MSKVLADAGYKIQGQVPQTHEIRLGVRNGIDYELMDQIESELKSGTNFRAKSGTKFVTKLRIKSSGATYELG